MSGYSDTAAVAYVELIKEQLLEERSRKASLEQRSVSIIQTSGTLVTLLFALAALITKPTAFVPPAGVLTPLPLALIAFSLAALAALAINIPRDYEEVDEDDLVDRLNKGEWQKPASLAVASEHAAKVRVAVLKSARGFNDLKEKLLTTAIVFEVLGIAVVAWIVMQILVGS